MKLTTYQPQKLQYFLESQLKQNTNGVLVLETQVDSWQKQRQGILVIRNNTLVYGGTTIPSNQQLAKSLGAKLKPKSINAAIAVASKKLADPKSIRELISILVKLKVFDWKNVEAYIQNQVVSILEQFELYSGKSQWKDINNFDLCFGEDCHGLNWMQIKQDLKTRKQKWASLTPTIPTMDAVPYVSPSNLVKLNLLKINNPKVGEHIETYVDGHRTLIDIATKMGKDPLKVANSYANWVKSGAISFNDPVEVKTQAIATPIKVSGSDANLPTVLSVDDSPIVQVSIRRALAGHYNLLCASKAADALTILDQNSVELLLLDLTMPDIDGLEFCKTIRQIPQFHDLPVIMVTARDGLINKMKGQIAGTNGYITKPFTAEELLEVIGKYIKVHEV